MSAKHALLGLLLERPAYPYQLANRMEQRLGPAWKVNSGQLYQTIKSLERDRLIERVRSGAPEHGERHVFSVTEEGALEFERFFATDGEAVRLSRRPLLVKITFAGPEHLDQALAKVDAYERECAERLAKLARLREQQPADTPGGAGEPLLRADQLLLRLNLSADVFQLEGELRWARHAREMLSWLASREAVWPAGHERADSAGARRDLFERILGSSSPSSSDDEEGESGRRP
jgi:DNA-binding PadR family transcriptional regulator